MKIIPTIIAGMAALPLLAQEAQPTPDTQEPTPPAMKCNKCGNPMAGECPRAAVAATLGFQKGFLMGFEAGFGQAAALMLPGNAQNSPCCKEGKCGPRGGHGKPNRPAPQPRQQEPGQEPPAEPAA